MNGTITFENGKTCCIHIILYTAFQFFTRCCPCEGRSSSIVSDRPIALLNQFIPTILLQIYADALLTF